MSLAAQLQDAGNVLAFLGLPPLVAYIVLYFRGSRRPALIDAACALMVTANVLSGIGSLLLAQWGQAALNFALAAWLAWLLWRGQRKRRKAAAALLGAKSRALKDALVRKAREAAQPRPALRPVPQGAGR